MITPGRGNRHEDHRVLLSRDPCVGPRAAHRPDPTRQGRQGPVRSLRPGDRHGHRPVHADAGTPQLHDDDTNLSSAGAGTSRPAAMLTRHSKSRSPSIDRAFVPTSIASGGGGSTEGDLAKLGGWSDPGVMRRYGSVSQRTGTRRLRRTRGSVVNLESVGADLIRIVCGESRCGQYVGANVNRTDRGPLLTFTSMPRDRGGAPGRGPLAGSRVTT